MFIAMNRFRIRPGSEEDFERIWRERDSYLDDVPGFRTFHLLRGARGEEFSLYATHTVWDDEKSFRAWTQSEAFRKAHQGAGANRDLYLGHPQFEGFEPVEGLV